MAAPSTTSARATGPGDGAVSVRRAVPPAARPVLAETPGAVAVTRAFAAAQKATGSVPRAEARPSGSEPRARDTVSRRPTVMRLVESCRGPSAKPCAARVRAPASAPAVCAGRTGGGVHAIGDGPAGAGPSPNTARKRDTHVGAPSPPRR